eukprot:SM000007S20818  [mRNA]  locus=s7:452949:453811:+ [translate_table: standard]
MSGRPWVSRDGVLPLNRPNTPCFSSANATSNNPCHKDSGTLSTGLIVGLALCGAVFVLAIVLWLVGYFCYTRPADNRRDRTNQTAEAADNSIPQTGNSTVELSVVIIMPSGQSVVGLPANPPETGSAEPPVDEEPVVPLQQQTSSDDPDK